ncbi:MAG: FHA domain-containing protein [Deltaproteobacteria bacterium]|nr:FHA domain-containing protein [Deltaproteobacteria bacterium]MBW2308773.1 FHA domain-containing protein [Deltaproteobacteria bacterium]
MKLEILNGPLDGLVFRVDRPRAVIGRDPSCEVVITGDSRVSRKHAVIYHNNNGYWLEDSKSRNGTFLEGKKVSVGVLLKSGSILKMGGTLLHFEE